jgi:hypothetical protein
MGYKRGEKINIKEGKIGVEIIGVLPSSQPFQMNWSGTTIYNVRINDKHTAHVKEETLAAIIASGIIVVDTNEEEVTNEPVVEPIEQMPKAEEVVAKKRGRPFKMN